MIKKNNEETLFRLKRVLLNDKIKMPNGLPNLLKTDLNLILASYFDYDKNDLAIAIVLNETGKYEIAITATAERIKPCGYIEL